MICPIFCEQIFVENLKNLIGALDMHLSKISKTLGIFLLCIAKNFLKKDFYPTSKVFEPKSRRKLLNVISPSRKKFIQSSIFVYLLENAKFFLVFQVELQYPKPK